MSNTIRPEICKQEQVYTPALEPCDECDRLAAEFEEARNEAVQAAADAIEASESAQASATIATEASEVASTSASSASESADLAQEALTTIQGMVKGQFIMDYETMGLTESITFTAEDYTYSAGDRYEVYINGLRLNKSEWSQNENVVTLETPITQANQIVEIIVYGNADSAGAAEQYARDAQEAASEAQAAAESVSESAEQILQNTSDISDLQDAVEENKVLVITSSTFSALPTTITDARITSDMVSLKEVLSNSAAQNGDWEATTADGSVTITGSISGSTSITLYLLKERS